MKLATPIQMKKTDEIAIKEYKIPGIILMENAALYVVKKASEMLDDQNANRVIIIAGKGNNGGDAFAAARHLMRNYQVSIISLTPRSNITGDAKIFLDILENLKADIKYCTNKDSLPELKRCISKSNLIIDGIFGTGIHGDITGFYADVIKVVNESRLKVLSVDIPSGIDGSTGQICKVAIKADSTVTFSLPKPGLCQFPGREYSGNITIEDIGIPAVAVEQADLTGELIDCDYVFPRLLERQRDGHKGTFGKIMIITGSKGMTGAGMLTALAAFKTGSGLVYLAVPESLTSIYGISIPEAITIPLKDEDGVIKAENLDLLTDRAKTMDAVVIGPGLSINAQIKKLVNNFVVEYAKPLVIDADALNVIDNKTLIQRKYSTIITPHPGEFARLTGYTADDIQKNRIEKAVEYSKQTNAIVILKGAGTVIACPDEKYFINTTGHHCMAVAGSGDVLAGMIGSLLGQNMSLEDAACVGVFIHGRCGETLAQENNGQAGYRANEFCSVIPSVIGQIKKDRSV